MAKYLGIDGGGSSIRILITDESGRPLYKSKGGPANVLVVGEQRARDALYDILPSHTYFDGVVAGLAGSDRPAVREFWDRVLNPIARQHWVIGDYRIAWAALTEGQPGLVAIVGTGSIVYAENGKDTTRLGGYGWRIGDAGSGLTLGHDAIEAVLADCEGWGPHTSLTDHVMDWASAKSPEEILNHLYRPDTDWRTASDLAATVLREAGRDGVAHTIIERHQEVLIRYFRAALERCPLPPFSPLGLTGGLASMWHSYLEPLVYEAAGVHLRLSSHEPVQGALQLARLWSKTKGVRP